MDSDIRSLLSTMKSPTGAALAVLSLASGIYTYKGATLLLSAEGFDWWTKGVALVFAAAVTAAIWVFWLYAFAFLPRVRSWSKIIALLLIIIGLGFPAIFGMSSWQNAQAFFGVASMQQHLAATVSDYEGVLQATDRRSQTARQILPNLRVEANRFRSMADQEQNNGTLTGSRGNGAVVVTLRQVGDRIDALVAEVEKSFEANAGLVDEARRHLATMRDLVRGHDAIDARTTQFSDIAVKLDAVIARLDEGSVVPAIRRTAENLQAGLVLPATSRRNAALAVEQDKVMTGVREALDSTGAYLAQAALAIERQPPVAHRRYEPLNPASTVILYAKHFVPGWIAAVSIDLMPFVLVLFLMVVHAAGRQEEAEHAQRADGEGNVFRMKRESV